MFLVPIPGLVFFSFIRHLKCLEDIFRVEMRGRDYKREWTMDQTENRQRMHVIILMSLFSVYLVFGCYRGSTDWCPKGLCHVSGLLDIYSFIPLYPFLCSFVLGSNGSKERR